MVRHVDDRAGEVRFIFRGVCRGALRGVVGAQAALGFTMFFGDVEPALFLCVVVEGAQILEVLAGVALRPALGGLIQLGGVSYVGSLACSCGRGAGLLNGGVAARFIADE